MATAQRFRRSLAWNREPARVLMSYYPDRTIADQYWSQLKMDHLTLVAPSLTDITPRGDFYSGGMHVAALEPYTLTVLFQ